jgi:hypothetical protein
VLALVVLFAACKADVRVDIAVRDDGSGTVAVQVVLDADAMRRLSAFGPLDQAVPLDDLRAAGWDVSAWSTTSDGGATTTLSHEFTGEADLERVLGDLAVNGTFGDVQLARERGLFRTRDEISVGIDLRALAAGVRSDAALAANLRAAGIDVDALDAELTEQLRDALTVELVVHAPDGTTRSMTIEPGTADRTSVSASSFDRERVVVLVAGVLLAVAALVLLAIARASKRRTRRRVRGAARDRAAT